MRIRIALALLAAPAALSVPSGVQAQTVPTCFGRKATPIVGTAGDDNLLGDATEGTDVIVGLGGSDAIDGKEGDDFYCGNSGDDQLADDLGDDHISGDGGNDAFNEAFTPGNDVLDGGSPWGRRNATAQSRGSGTA